MSTDDNGRAFSRFIGMRLREVDEDGGPVVEAWAPVTDAVGRPGGGMATGVLLTLADGVGGLCGGLAVLPRWVVSTNLMLRLARPDHVGPIRGRARVLRRGRSGVVTAIDLRDEGNDNALVGEAVLTSAALDPPDGMWIPRRPIELDPGPPIEMQGSLGDALGIYEVDPPVGYDTAVRLEVTDEVRNPWGIVHGGATAVLVDAAAGGRAGDSVVHFLHPGRVGPMEARARVIDSVVRVDVCDTGASDRRTAGATVRRG